MVHGTDSFREKIDKPLIITHNGNGYPGDKFHPNTVFVSRDHARRHKSEMFVYNGINPAEYPAIQEEAKSPFCYFLAKARWKVKNVSGAIDVARAAGMPIQIIGGWRPSFRHDVRWRGMLGGEKKNEILRTGSALLFPVRWHEPFGIAVIEAMLTGSPVFGTPYGALPELITEETGFISNRKNDLANALKKYAEYDRKTLRKRVLDHFTHLHMAEKYLEYYHHVISGKTLNPHEPETLTRVSAQLLLEWQ
ncbi:MAG: glycosyltransferase [Verrucomicrobia bacterium]|nr:glycosyltransferase [Verrucomicrobiota bacterium]